MSDSREYVGRQIDGIQFYLTRARQHLDPKYPGVTLEGLMRAIKLMAGDAITALVKEKHKEKRKEKRMNIDLYMDIVVAFGATFVCIFISSLAMWITTFIVKELVDLFREKNSYDR